MRLSGRELNSDGVFGLRVSEDDFDVACLRLPSHSATSSCEMSKFVRLRDLIDDCDGPGVVLDFWFKRVFLRILR
jgi:hypothetical protein